MKSLEFKIQYAKSEKILPHSAAAACWFRSVAEFMLTRFDEKKEDRKNLSTANTFLTRFYCPVVLCCKWRGKFEIVNWNAVDLLWNPWKSNLLTALQTQTLYSLQGNPVSQFPQGKNCFHYRVTLFSSQVPCFDYRVFPVFPCTSL